MFVNQRHLRHLLKPEHYLSPEQDAAERERVFAPAWHPVVAAAKLRRPGDFVTRELLGRPILLRNADGQIHAYFNVCPHRHARLTGKAKGRMPKLRCQYHGWEFEPAGHTGKIPDAKSFRPWDRENSRLAVLPCETIGGLVFVRLSTQGPSLREYLGPMAEWAEEAFGSRFRFAWQWQTDYNANWKLPVENSLESYHMSMVHTLTLGPYPPEEVCSHTLGDRHTSFRVPVVDRVSRALLGFYARLLGATPQVVYQHHHVFPSLTFVEMDLFRMTQVVWPLTPTTSRHHVWLFTLKGRRWNPLHWITEPLIRAGVTAFSWRVLKEDAPLFPEVQRGLAASPHPGVIGCREERVFVFQRWLLEQLQTGKRPLQTITPDCIGCETG